MVFYSVLIVLLMPALGPKAGANILAPQGELEGDRRPLSCVTSRASKKGAITTGTHTGRRNKYCLTRISFLALDIMALICSAVMGAPPPGAALAIGVVS